MAVLRRAVRRRKAQVCFVVCCVCMCGCLKVDCGLWMIGTVHCTGKSYTRYRITTPFTHLRRHWVEDRRIGHLLGSHLTVQHRFPPRPLGPASHSPLGRQACEHGGADLIVEKAQMLPPEA